MNKTTITPMNSDNYKSSNFLDTERITTNSNKAFSYQKVCDVLLTRKNNIHSQPLKYMFEDIHFTLYT